MACLAERLVASGSLPAPPLEAELHKALGQSDPTGSPSENVQALLRQLITADAPQQQRMGAVQALASWLCGRALDPLSVVSQLRSVFPIEDEVAGATLAPRVAPLGSEHNQFILRSMALLASASSQPVQIAFVQAALEFGSDADGWKHLMAPIDAAWLDDEDRADASVEFNRCLSVLKALLSHPRMSAANRLTIFQAQTFGGGYGPEQLHQAARLMLRFSPHLSRSERANLMTMLASFDATARAVVEQNLLGAVDDPIDLDPVLRGELAYGWGLHCGHEQRMDLLARCRAQEPVVAANDSAGLRRRFSALAVQAGLNLIPHNNPWDMRSPIRWPERTLAIDVARALGGLGLPSHIEVFASILQCPDSATPELAELTTRASDMELVLMLECVWKALATNRVGPGHAQASQIREAAPWLLDQLVSGLDGMSSSVLSLGAKVAWSLRSVSSAALTDDDQRRIRARADLLLRGISAANAGVAFDPGVKPATLRH